MTHSPYSIPPPIRNTKYQLARKARALDFRAGPMTHNELFNEQPNASKPIKRLTPQAKLRSKQVHDLDIASQQQSMYRQEARKAFEEAKRHYKLYQKYTQDSEASHPQYGSSHKFYLTGNAYKKAVQQDRINIKKNAEKSLAWHKHALKKSLHCEAKYQQAKDAQWKILQNANELKTRPLAQKMAKKAMTSALRIAKKNNVHKRKRNE